MAYIRKKKYKKKSSFQVQVRRQGFKTLVKSFETKTDAKKWARAMERKFDMGDYSNYSEASKLTVRDLMLRYLAENKHRKKKGWRMEEYRVNYINEDTIADTNCLRLSSKHLIEFRERRLKKVSTSTFNKDLSFISIVIETAMHDWGIYFPHNPCRSLKREKESQPRNRRLINDEQRQLIEACALSDNKYLKPMVQFSIETAIRQGELLKLTHKQINWDDRIMTLTDTKNGEDREVPLSEKAYLILRSQITRIDGRIFPMTKDSLKFWFKQAKRRANIKDFRWHDLRRHACSLLFERGLSVPEVQSISGHRDPRILLSTYTKLDPKKIVKKLG